MLSAAAVTLVAVAITRPQPPGYVPTPAGQLGTADPVGGTVTTIDASAGDAWRFFSFARGVLPGRAAGLEWDLAFRRFHIIANGGPGFAGAGAVADLGAVPFERANARAARFEPTVAGRDSVNPAIERWYDYGFTSHLLKPLDRTYLVRTADGGLVTLRILGYYCPGAVPGCLTFRWAPLPPPEASTPFSSSRSAPAPSVLPGARPAG
jgi:hypothetical protein